MSLNELPEVVSTDQSEEEEEEEEEEDKYKEREVVVEKDSGIQFSSYIDTLRTSLVDLITTSKDQTFKLHSLAQLNANEESLNCVLELKLNQFKLKPTDKLSKKNQKDTGPAGIDPFTYLETFVDSELIKEKTGGECGGFESLKNVDNIETFFKIESTDACFDNLESL